MIPRRIPWEEAADPMPAKQFLEKFVHDPATFQYDAFRDALMKEIDADDDLAGTKITALTATNTALGESERDLKVRLFDATVMRQGTPVAPSDSPSAPAAGDPGTTVSVPDSELFG